MIKMKTSDFKLAYEKHIHFLAQDCIGWEEMCGNFENCDLSGYELSGMNFSKANFRNCDFSNADLRACHFDGCDLSGARFRSVKGQMCSFTGATFTHASIIDSIFIRSNFDLVKMDHCHLRGGTFYKTSWFEADLRNNLFDFCNLGRIHFIRTSFTRKNTFVDCTLTDCVIDEIEGFENIVIDNCNFGEEIASGLSSLKYICKREYREFQMKKLRGVVKEKFNNIAKPEKVFIEEHKEEKKDEQDS